MECKMPSKRKSDVGSQGRNIVVSVFNFLKEEFEFTKSLNQPSCDLSHLENIVKRTADSTGVSIDTVQEILKEEKDLPIRTHIFPLMVTKKRVNAKKKSGDTTASSTNAEESAILPTLDTRGIKLETDGNPADSTDAADNADVPDAILPDEIRNASKIKMEIDDFTTNSPDAVDNADVPDAVVNACNIKIEFDDYLADPLDAVTNANVPDVVDNAGLPDAEEIANGVDQKIQETLIKNEIGDDHNTFP